jgi:ADP-heptose:LPS heptosyltransferase
MPQSGQPTILLIESFQIGDFCATTAVGQALRQLFPQAHITLLVKPLGRTFFEAATWFDEILFFELPWARPGLSQLAPSLWFDLLRFGVGLRRSNFDYVVVTIRNVRHWLILNLVGRNRKVIPAQNAPQVIIDRALSTVRSLGYVGLGLPHLEIPERNIEKAKQILTGFGLQPYNFILLHPGASHSIRRWLPGQFVALSYLLHKDGWKFAYMGHGTEDDQFIAQIGAEIGQKPLYLDLPLPLSMSVVSLASAFVGMDSGFSHIAAALDIPTIALYGPSLVAFSAVVGRRVKLIDNHRNCACKAGRNCRRTRCALMKRPCEALASISADEVFRALQDLLTSSNRL